MMDDQDLKMFIGNRTSNLYVTMDRLIHNLFPRGLFNEYENSILEISQLQKLEVLPNFLSIYASEIKKQEEIFKETELQIVSAKIAAFNTPTLLKKYCDKLFADNFISFLNEEDSYIKNLLSSRSRQKTKRDYLAKVKERLLFATQLLRNANLLDKTIQYKITETEMFTTTKLANLSS